VHAVHWTQNYVKK